MDHPVYEILYFIQLYSITDFSFEMNLQLWCRRNGQLFSVRV